MAGVEPEAGARPVDRDSDAEDRASSDDSSEKIVRRKKSKKSKKEKKEKKEKKRRREASAGSEESGGAPSPKKRRGAADADEGSDGDSEPKGSVADEAAADPDVWDLGDETEEWKRVLSRVGHEDDDDRRLLEDLEREDNVDQKEEDKKPASKKLIDTITLSRTRDVVPHCHLGFLFTKIVKGAFVRALAGQDKDGHKIYALFEVEDAKPTGVNPETGAAITYKVNDKVTDWLLLCRTGERPREMRLSAISDQRCTEKEFVTYLKRMERAERPVMSTKRANEKRTEIWKLYSDYYSQPLSTEQVDEIIHTRQRLRGTASVNLIRNKLILQQKLEQLTRLKIKEENDPLTELPPAVLLEAIAEEKSRFAGVEDMRSESERDREREERGWQIYYEQQAQSKRHLETELSETEQKLKSVLYGQNSSVAARRYCHLQRLPGRLRFGSPQIKPNIGKRNFSPAKARDRKPLLPPPLPENVGKVCLVLDLDETLVYTSWWPVSQPDIISPVENSTEVSYVKKRPFVDEFLRFCSPLFEVVIFTAATSEYANPLLDQLDPGRQLLAHRLFREHCTVTDANWYVKDLSLLGRPLEKICIIDDTSSCFSFQPQYVFARMTFSEWRHTHEERRNIKKDRIENAPLLLPHH